MFTRLSSERLKVASYTKLASSELPETTKTITANSLDITVIVDC